MVCKLREKIVQVDPIIWKGDGYYDTKKIPISYLVVDSTIRSKGIGKELEEFATASARKRGCDRIQVHCHSRRIDAHRFYERQGFKEAPKYFSKMLDNDEPNTNI